MVEIAYKMNIDLSRYHSDHVLKHHHIILIMFFNTEGTTLANIFQRVSSIYI